MIVTTTSTIDGYRVVAYHGIVRSHVMQGANALKDFAAKVRDVFGGRSGTMEKVLGKADMDALNSIISQSKAAGANAIIGVSVEYEPIELQGVMILVVAMGTAVTIEPLDGSVKSEPASVLTTRPSPPRSVSEALAASETVDPGELHQQDRYAQREIGEEFDPDR